MQIFAAFLLVEGARAGGGERGANASGPVRDIRPTPQPPSGFGMCQKYRIRIFYYDDDSACRERLLGGRASAFFPVRNSQRESSPLEYSSARTMNETEEKYVARLRNAAAAGARNGSWRYGAAVSPVANCAASVRNGRKTSTPTRTSRRRSLRRTERAFFVKFDEVLSFKNSIIF